MKKLNKIFQVYFNIFPILWLIFHCHQQKIQKKSIFDILMTITLAVNMITRQMTPFFSPTLWALSVGIFHFDISFQFYGVSYFNYCFVSKLHVYTKDDTFNFSDRYFIYVIDIDIFLKQNLLTFGICFVPNDMIPIPWINVKLHYASHFHPNFHQHTHFTFLGLIFTWG